MNNTNEKVKSITRTPDFLLHLKGRLDAYGGKTVIDANIDKYYDRLYAIEHEEVVRTEAGLYEVRKKAVGYISGIRKSQETLASAPSDLEEKTDSDVRANQRNKNAKNLAFSSILSSTGELVAANEQIISEGVRLQERIGEARDLAEAKIHVYVMGVRSSRKLKEYEVKNKGSNNHAVELYQEKHRALDEAIQAAAYKNLKEAQ